MTKLPPPIMTSEKGSFARKTIEVLKPGIIDNILSEFDYTPQIRESLIGLQQEMKAGQMQPLHENASDRALWDADIAPYLGKGWLQIPWFFAESYFFRRVLEAVQYFQPGPWQGNDPFQYLKNREISKALQPFTEAYQSQKEGNKKENFQSTCHLALWGNQSDLSNLEEYDTSKTLDIERYVFDQSEIAYDYLVSHNPTRIAYFLDNVGRELYFDLAFIDYLLQSELANSITCYLKNQPFFVSDAQPKEFLCAVDFLESSPLEKCKGLADRLKNGIKSGKIKLESPPFLTTSRSFRRIPEALKNQLTNHGSTILKGDVNFRRLIGDRHWDPTTPIEIAAGYFYTPFLSMRTLKSELIVGLTKSKLKKLETQAEKDWLLNGQRGMILFLE